MSSHVRGLLIRRCLFGRRIAGETPIMSFQRARFPLLPHSFHFILAQLVPCIHSDQLWHADVGAVSPFQLGSQYRASLFSVPTAFKHFQTALFLKLVFFFFFFSSTYGLTFSFSKCSTSLMFTSQFSFI